jgi:hypothetical protein
VVMLRRSKSEPDLLLAGKPNTEAGRGLSLPGSPLAQGHHLHAPSLPGAALRRFRKQGGLIL